MLDGVGEEARPFAMRPVREAQPVEQAVLPGTPLAHAPRSKAGVQLQRGRARRQKEHPAALWHAGRATANHSLNTNGQRRGRM
eukprot:13480485-Alexandrium_andersonii.AAC.1